MFELIFSKKHFPGPDGIIVFGVSRKLVKGDISVGQKQFIILPGDETFIQGNVSSLD
jgi:hypothetical protein